MEKQAIRLKDKWRDSKREPHRPDRTMPDNNTGPDGVTDLGEIKKTAS